MPRLQCKQGRASGSHQTPLAVLLNKMLTQSDLLALSRVEAEWLETHIVLRL